MISLICWKSLILTFLCFTIHVSAMLVNPGLADMQGFGNKIGQQFCFRITAIGVGEPQDKIWGTKIYTSDSRLRTAVVHGGWAQRGQTVQVIVLIVEGQQSYVGTTRDGINSNDYPKWSLSYSFLDYCCQDGEYSIPKDSTCLPCQHGCTLCSDSASNCQSCSEKFGLHGSECKECTNGQYSNGPELPCTQCKLGCAQCGADTTLCEQCEPGYYFKDSQCLLCPNKTTSSGGTVTKCEQSCSSSCRRCKTSSLCLECERSYLLVNNDTGGYCQACPDLCEECETLITCKTCNSKSMLINDKCLLCGPGSYSNSTSGACENCSPGCVQCTNPNTCEHCQIRFDLDENFQCVNKKPPWQKITDEYVMLISIGGVGVSGIAIIIGLRLLFTKIQQSKKHKRLSSLSPNESYRVSSFNIETKSPTSLDE